MNVLVVDDTKNIRALLTKCLELAGYTVKTAEDGRTALSMIEKERFDLAFLDIKMPLLSGTEVLRRMRDMGVTMPVIIITAYATVKNAVDCTQLGAVAYLQKPFTADKIKTVLNEIMTSPAVSSCSQRNPKASSTAFTENKGSLDTVIKHAEELVTCGDYTGALSVLRAETSENPFSQRLFSLLADVSEKLGKDDDAKKYRKLRDALD